MAIDQDEEIEDVDSDQEINDDEEEDLDEDDESEGDEEDAEDDDDDESDSDDEATLPKTRKELAAIVAKEVRAALKSKNNRDGADRRNSKKDRLSDRKRPVSDGRVDELSSTVKELQHAEVKRQFGHANSLTPDEVDLVFKLTGNKPKAKDLRDPAIKGAIDGYRTAKKAKSNTPSGNFRPATRISAKEEKNLTPAEKHERFVQKRQGLLETQGRR